MAMVKQESIQGFQGLPALRQIGLMIGLAASVALGVAVVLWSQEPNYTVLYAGLGNKDAGQVVDALKKSGIAFEVDQSTGAVMVASGRVHDARMELAKDGLPEGSAMGFEMLQKDQGFGTSQFIETARFQRALEGELSRTISTLRNVETARVHLAIPKRSVFLRERADPTASVMVDLYSGRSLDEDQVAAIVHLVSSSVPHLEPEKVTIVDQRGNLLSNGSDSGEMAPSSSQFAYSRKLEITYTDRIRKLLDPIVGAGRTRATVNADLDFTVTELTQESYNPDLPALRSEQVSEDVSRDGAGPSGIPGALSNQPPGTASLQEPNDGSGDAVAEGTNGNRSKRSVRNYELDKTISHTRLATGGIRRLSIAVVVDNKQELDENDELVNTPWSADELERFTALIKESVGFDGQRGDTVNVFNASFVSPPEPEPVPEATLMEQPWIWDVAKQAAGALGLLIVVFGVLKPVMRSLAEKGTENAKQQAALAAAVAAGGDVNAGGQDQLNLTGGTPQLAAPQGGYEQSLETVKGVVNDDPKRVAQVVKNWVGEDG